MSTMAQERIMAQEADAAAEGAALREALAESAEKKLDTLEPAAPGPRVPHVIREAVKPETGVCGHCNAPLMRDDGTPTARAWRVIGTRLAEPMTAKTRKGKAGMEFSYINARQAARRLDEVVGPGNWSTQVQVIRAEHPVSVMVGVGIFGVWKFDVGYSNNPDADDETDKGYEDEPLKAAVSDGFKRAAVQWGVGRWLYGD